MLTKEYSVYDDMIKLCKMFCLEDLKDAMEKLRRSHNAVNKVKRGIAGPYAKNTEEKDEEES